jgi:hypothetical protein
VETVRTALPVAGHEELCVGVTVRPARLPARHTHRRLWPANIKNFYFKILLRIRIRDLRAQSENF